MMRIYNQAFAAVAKGRAFLHCRTRSRREVHRSSCCATAADGNVSRTRRALSIALVVSLLATSTPAAPQTIVGVGTEWKASLGFWLRGNGFPSKLRQALTGQTPPRPKAQERQESRDARVRRIEISPGDVISQVGDRVSFAAVAYDSDDAPVSGVHFRWGGVKEVGSSDAVVFPTGEFEARAPGKYKVEVEGAGRRAHVRVTVIDTGRLMHNLRELPNVPKKVSTRDLSPLPAVPGIGKRQDKRLRPRDEARFVKASHKRAAAPPATVPAAVAALLQPDEWNDTNYMTADDPGNEVGDPPGNPVDDGSGSGNFQLTAPVLGLPGRGIDLSLGLTYNSRVWNKADNQMTFDIDRNWPAPGWSLGFGKIVNLGATTGGLLIDADGTRHSFKGSILYGLFNAHTTDGTFIDYSGQIYTDGTMTYFQAKYPNGTVVKYDTHGQNAAYPTRITDASGNYLTITYRNNTGPQIDKVVDTLGRPIQFYYDSAGLLTAITAPGLGGNTRTLVRVTYQTHSLGYNYGGMTVSVRSNPVNVIRAIYYPGTNTGYWFGGADSYSSYGMIAKVQEQRGMGFSGPAPVPPAQGATEQDTISAGTTTQEAVYDYPLAAGGALADAPTYENETVTWDTGSGMSAPAVTNYSVERNASNPAQPGVASSKTTITLPDQTQSVQWTFNYSTLPENDPNKYKDGLVYADETYAANGATLLKSSSVTWDRGAYESPRPLRLEATDKEINQTTASEFSYGPVYNQVAETRDYGYTGNLLRLTATQYENSSNYTNRHIFNLPTVVEVYTDLAKTNRVSRSEYEYDNAPLQNLTLIGQYDQTYNPHTTDTMSSGTCLQYVPNCTYQCWYNFHWETCYNYSSCPGPCQWAYNNSCCQTWQQVSVYNSSTLYRGNVTKVTQYKNASVTNLSGPISETRTYDIAGNLRTAATACCEQTSFDYPQATQYGYPLSQTRGSATNGDLQVKTSATYDFNTGLVLSAKDANGRQSETSYFPETLRPHTATMATGAHTHYVYDDILMSMTETTYAESHTTNESAIADQNIKLLNGRGQVQQEQARGANGVWDLVDVVYDNMGRVSQQTRPYRSLETKQWSTTTYDALSRVISVQAPDQSTTQSFYNEASRPNVASTAAGETTRVVDAWGRERWGRTDAQGRLVEVVEPNPTGGGSVASGGLLTTYAYNTLGKLVSVTQGAQTRTFNYDSLGRLIAQKLAETNATLNDAGVYIGAGQWSDVFTYDDRSNLISRTDARGVKTIYNFGEDPLNRLQSVEWNMSGFGDTANPVLPAANVNYSYRTKDTPAQLRDVTQLSSVSTTDVSTESYIYDSEGRVEIKTQTLANRLDYPFVTNYIYDELDRVKDVRYPAEYGNGTQPRKVVHHEYDVASRLTGLTVDGQSHASQIVYNASSQTTSLNVGASGPNQMIESYDYDPQTGLLAGQTAARSLTPDIHILNLSYDYAGTNGKRTGQVTKILNNLNHNKDRSYIYDALGRLSQAKGGPSGSLWTQTYSYDRYGNRESVSATGYSASNRGSRPSVKEGSTAGARTGNAGVSPALSAQREPADPKVILPNDQLVARTEVELPDALRTDAPRSTSDSSFNLGSRPAPSNPATAQGPPVFTDDPLVVGVTVIKAVHVTQLRDAVNQARARVALAAAIWTDAALQGVPIKAIHILELRARLDDARLVMGLGAASYTDPSLSAGNTVRAVHVQELRARVIEAINAPLGPINLALNRPATQSSTHSDPNHPNLTFAANLAVDGNTNGDIHAGYSAVTTYQMQPWWQVDLGSVQSIGSIQIWGRTDCCPEMTSNFYVLVSDQPFVSTDLSTARNQAGVWSYYVPGYSGTPGTINVNRSGRYVRVQMAATHYLVLAEVKVWQSTGSASIPLDGHANLSYNQATNRITTAGFAYDAAGNQTRALAPSGGSQRFKYDAANRLRQVLADDNVTVLASYTYGDSNQRLITEEWGLRTYYVSDGGSVLAEYFESGSSVIPAWSKSYIYLGARLLSTLTPNGSGGEVTQYHHPDRLGTRLVTNAQDTTYFEQASLPFGTPLNAESTGATNRRFTSYDRSVTTGLDYAVNRHYDPQQGRFTQVDPIGMAGSTFDDPQSFNLYVYCTNDPVNYIDPAGLFFKKLFSAIGKAFRSVMRVLKWVMVAVVVALAVVAIVVSPAAALGLLLKIGGFLTKIGIFKGGAALGFTTAEAGTAIGLGITGKILAVAAAVGAVASHLQGPGRGSPKQEEDIEIIRIEVNACSNGEEFPDCGIIIDVPPPGEPMEMGTIPVRAIFRGLRGLIRRIRGIRPVRSLKDLETLRGSSRQEIERLIPKDWVGTPTRTGNGIRYANPVRPGDQIRIMPGNRLDPQLIKQGPYAIVTRSGGKYRIPLEGNPTLP